MDAQPGDERIQQSVDRMQRIIDLGRTIRERKNKPVKLPLRRLVVVHDDAEFLADMGGELKVGGFGGGLGLMDCI